MLRVALAIALPLLLCAVSLACPPYAGQQVQSYYVQPAQAQTYQVQQAVATYYVPQPIQQFYSLGVEDDRYAEQERKLELLNLKVEVQQLKLQQLQYQQFQQPPQQQEQMPYSEPQALPQKTSLLHGKCGRCHEDSRSESSGGGFAMFRGGTQVQFSQAQKAAIADRLWSDDPAKRMPLGGQLTHQQKVSIVAQL